jgi:hypothetical protein
MLSQEYALLKAEGFRGHVLPPYVPGTKGQTKHLKLFGFGNYSLWKYGSDAPLHSLAPHTACGGGESPEFTDNVFGLQCCVEITHKGAQMAGVPLSVSIEARGLFDQLGGIESNTASKHVGELNVLRNANPILRDEVHAARP